MTRLDREYFAAQRKYEKALKIRGLNSETTRQIHREFVRITARVLKRNMRKSA